MTSETPICIIDKMVIKWPYFGKNIMYPGWMDCSPNVCCVVFADSLVWLMGCVSQLHEQVFSNIMMIQRFWRWLETTIKSLSKQREECKWSYTSSLFPRFPPGLFHILFYVYPRVKLLNMGIMNCSRCDVNSYKSIWPYIMNYNQLIYFRSDLPILDRPVSEFPM